MHGGDDRLETILPLDRDSMQVHYAPHPDDIVWDNIAVPQSQINYRVFITNVGLVVGSFFWSSLVTAINDFARTFHYCRRISRICCPCLFCLDALSCCHLYSICWRDTTSVAS